MNKLEQIDGLMVALEDTLNDLNELFADYGIVRDGLDHLPLYFLKDLRDTCALKETLKDMEHQK